MKVIQKLHFHNRPRPNSINNYYNFPLVQFNKGIGHDSDLKHPALPDFVNLIFLRVSRNYRHGIGSTKLNNGNY